MMGDHEILKSSLRLTMVRRPSASKVFSMGSVSSRKSSSRLLNDETESSKRPRPS